MSFSTSETYHDFVVGQNRTRECDIEIPTVCETQRTSYDCKNHDPMPSVTMVERQAIQSPPLEPAQTWDEDRTKYAPRLFLSANSFQSDRLFGCPPSMDWWQGVLNPLGNHLYTNRILPQGPPSAST
jgi:hypothetical protein